MKPKENPIMKEHVEGVLEQFEGVNLEGSTGNVEQRVSPHIPQEQDATLGQQTPREKEAAIHEHNGDGVNATEKRKVGNGEKKKIRAKK